MEIKALYMPVLVAVLLGTGPLVTAGTLEDPTRPANSALTSRNRTPGFVNNGWVLNSTLVAPDRRVAVINGVHVSEGESVGNATVLQIRKLEVVIQAAGKRKTLELLPDIVKNLP